MSYFTYKDEYWTVYYVKPYSRFPSFLVGLLAGCSYYSFKHEDPSGQRIAKILEALQFSRVRALVSHIVGMVLMNIMTFFLQSINNSPGDVPLAVNILFLVFSKLIYITGFSMMIFPMIVGSPIMKPMITILSHNFWTPFSRLSYVAFLVHGMFM